jgi:hypothetical protein
MVIKHIVQKSIKEKKMRTEDLSILAFKISDLKNKKYDFIWKKLGKEFRFNGKMYDIEAKLISADTIYYSVYYDHKENILEELFSLQQTDSKKDKSQSSVNRVLLAGLYFEQIKYLAYKVDICHTSNLPLDKNQAGFINHTTEIPSPPPRNNV